LIYDHPQSFEVESWIKYNEKQAKEQGSEIINTDFPVCFMNAGYSSGWCEESFGIELKAKEILCRGMGAPRCRFIMAPPEKIDEHIEEYKNAHPDLFVKKTDSAENR
jgi:hypothetical protein